MTNYTLRCLIKGSTLSFTEKNLILQVQPLDLIRAGVENKLFGIMQENDGQEGVKLLALPLSDKRLHTLKIEIGQQCCFIIVLPSRQVKLTLTRNGSISKICKAESDWDSIGEIFEE